MSFSHWFEPLLTLKRSLSVRTQSWHHFIIDQMLSHIILTKSPSSLRVGVIISNVYTTEVQVEMHVK